MRDVLEALTIRGGSSEAEMRRGEGGPQLRALALTERRLTLGDSHRSFLQGLGGDLNIG